MTEKLCSVYVTAKNEREAVKLAKALVSARLAACVNIYGGVRSIYRWEGKLESSDEAVLMAKTRRSLVLKLKKLVKKVHSYSCPCILVLPVLDADKGYAEWVVSETS